MELIGDKETQTLFKNSKVDVISLTQMALVNENNKAGVYPFLGPIYSKNNWALFFNYFKEIISDLGILTMPEFLEKVKSTLPLEWFKSFL